MKEHFERFLELLRTPPRSVRAAYDAVASRYDRYEQDWLRVAGAPAVARVEAVLAGRLPPAARVLDAGIGTGATAARVLAIQPTARVIGVDLSLEMLRAARQRLPRTAVRLAQADVTRLPFADDRFDAVVSTWVLETLPEPRAAVAEMLRVIQPDGFIVCAFSSAATDLLGALEGWVLRHPLSQFAGRFLTDAERPMHWCRRSSLRRFDHGLTTVITLSKCCTVDEFGPCRPTASQVAPPEGATNGLTRASSSP